MNVDGRLIGVRLSPAAQQLVQATIASHLAREALVIDHRPLIAD
ncbi:hypothetical protein [Paraburkholderia graminis]|nr:hypothetical protein [Paraburkholderia graminis]MDQ0627178.1 hypothetical protein [Paraburkholderia graminis]